MVGNDVDSDRLCREGIVIGCPNFRLFDKEFEEQCQRCFCSQENILSGGYSFRCLLKQGHLYRIGETILAEDKCLRISGIFSVRVESQYRHCVTAKVYGRVPCSGLQQLVVDLESDIVITANSISRKVILYQHPSATGSCSKHYQIIDYRRPCPLASAADIVIPCYPEKGDMFWVQGDTNEHWLGFVESIDERSQTVKLYFFVQHVTHEPGAYIRESTGLRATNTVHWNSLVGIAQGHWEGEKWILDDHIRHVHVREAHQQ